MSKQNMTTKEAAEHLGVNAKTLARWRGKKRGPQFYKIGDGWFSPIVYSVADLDAWAKSPRGTSLLCEKQGEVKPQPPKPSAPAALPMDVRLERDRIVYEIRKRQQRALLSARSFQDEIKQASALAMAMDYADLLEEVMRA